MRVPGQPRGQREYGVLRTPRSRRRHDWALPPLHRPRDLPDTDLAQRQWCVAHHPGFRRFALLFLVAVAGGCVAGAGIVGLASEGPPFC